MAFSSYANQGTSAFGSMGASPAVNNTPSVQQGPDLPEISTENLGFQSLAGEAKLRLLPTPWPAGDEPNTGLPPSTASLLSIASRKGLLAAAGPDAVVVAKTESVRKAFEGPATGDGDIRPFKPELTLPMNMRISQLAFSADDNYLVISAETGGGFAVYDVQALLNGSTNTAFEIGTNSEALRALVPNPTAEKAEQFAAVTENGKLLMANLKEKNLVSGQNGPVLKENVSCVSWSTRGKQLVAGLGDGTAVQLTPEGVVKAEIPRPPSVNAGDHVSSITWLENNVFLTVHTPFGLDDQGMAPASTFHLVTRSKDNPLAFMFQKLTDPAGPFGLPRVPPHHFFLRLREFPPALHDVLVVASSASTDVGLFTRSAAPLVSDKPAAEITNVFTMTELAEDSRRAQLPLSEGMSDTSPIGMAMDLSATEKVHRPLPKEEMDESPSPVPAVMILNNEGVLAAWWFIYAASIRESTAYPGLVAAGTSQSAPPALQPASAFGGGGTTSAFGQSAFGSIGKPAAPAFGAPSLGIGKSSSPWAAQSTSGPSTGSTPAFGAPAFGAPAFGAPAFGQPSAPTAPAFGSSGLPGQRASPWGSGGSAFGQASSLGSQPTGVFGSSSSNNAPASGGFASFANAGGFAAAGAPKDSGGSVFGKPGPIITDSAMDTGNSFGAPAEPQKSIFGAPAEPQKSVFGTPSGTEAEASKSLFGTGSSGFKLGTTFKPDGSAKDDLPKPDSSSLFGSGFGSALGEAAKSPAAPVPETKEADMSDEPATPQLEEPPAVSTTPADTPAEPKNQFQTTVPPVKGGLFGIPAPSSGKSPLSNVLNNSTTEPPHEPTKDNVPAIETKPEETTKIKEEPKTPDDVSPLDGIPEAPLPPDSTNNSPGPTPQTSSALPPGFDLPAATKPISADMIPPMDVPGGPEEEEAEEEVAEEEEEEEESDFVEDEASDEEGSGEDVAKDFSPVSDKNDQTLGMTPQSSFGGPTARSPDNSSPFTKINNPNASSSRGLFGEIGKNVPSFPPPPSSFQQSPRSPSPIRTNGPGRHLRPDNSRSVSAPGVASQLLSQQKKATPRPPPQTSSGSSIEQKQKKEEEKREAEARKQAEEAQALIDNADEAMQEFLNSDIQANRHLDDFIAHQHYYKPGDDDKNDVPAHVELVYRDINSMLDILGINRRSLESFIKGHTEQYKEEGRTRSDLEDDEDWFLVEIQDLSSVIERDLTRELEQGRVKDVPGKLAAVKEFSKELTRLNAKQNDIKKIMNANRDPDALANARMAPLTAEQASQQADLRKSFTDLQRQLAEVEAALTMLKAKLASVSGSSKAGRQETPTVEAVMRTIKKMTIMAEKRSGDVDVLENQMRRLRLASADPASREGSPAASAFLPTASASAFLTPQKSLRQSTNLLRTPGTGTGSVYFTPGESFRASGARGMGNSFMGNSFMSSTGSRMGTPSPRKKLSGFSEEEKEVLKRRVAQQKRAREGLRGALRKAASGGVKVKVEEGA